MDILIHTAERACVLVTLTFILAQTGLMDGKRVTTISRGPRRRRASTRASSASRMTFPRSRSRSSGRG